MTAGFAGQVVEIPCIFPKIRECYQGIVETGSQQTACTAIKNNKIQKNNKINVGAVFDPPIGPPNWTAKILLKCSE